MVGLNSSVSERKAVFAEADRDRSGQISWAEFKKLGHQLKQLRALPTRDEPGGDDGGGGERPAVRRRPVPREQDFISVLLFQKKKMSCGAASK